MKVLWFVLWAVGMCYATRVYERPLGRFLYWWRTGR